MEMGSVLFLMASYMVIGLLFSMHYANENFEDDCGSEFFYKIFGGWCDKSNVSYTGTMMLFSIVCWPIYLFTMAHSILWIIHFALTELIMCLYKVVKGIKETMQKKQTINKEEGS